MRKKRKKSDREEAYAVWSEELAPRFSFGGLSWLALPEIDTAVTVGDEVSWEEIMPGGFGTIPQRGYITDIGGDGVSVVVEGRTVPRGLITEVLTE